MKHNGFFISVFLLLIIGCKSVSLTEIEKRYILNDSNKSKYYLIDIIRKNQADGKLGIAPALFIDDNFVADSFKKLEEIQIKKNDINRIDITEKGKSVKLYGARGKDGFIKIWTRGNKDPLP